MPFAGVESPIAAYRIPANQGTLEVEIISPIEDKSAFVPSAVVLDSNFNVAATYPSSEFKFQEERGMQPNRFAAELNLTPAASQGYIYLLIYTTQQDLAKTTMIPHPAKLYAKGTGHQPPALNDIEVKHSLNGQIIVNVTNANGTRFIGMPTNIFSSSDKKAAQPVGAAPAPVPTANVATSKAVNVPVDKDTEAYFNQAITKALKAGDVNKAMNLVNEAEKLGLTSPRQTFLKQVSSK
ncbi:maltose operon protein [Aggregatibacter actinomycetemcomitans serotype e str. ANH9776]|nr:maltose operon protein [Aggregatibacter actinomycetemcomitans serotype e str. ANH9776]